MSPLTEHLSRFLNRKFINNNNTFFFGVSRPQSRTESYEDIDAVEEGTIGEQLAAERQRVEEEIEMMLRRPEGSIRRPAGPPHRRMLVRQASTLETPFDSSGSMKMTYWF